MPSQSERERERERESTFNRDNKRTNPDDNQTPFLPHAVHAVLQARVSVLLIYYNVRFVCVSECVCNMRVQARAKDRRIWPPSSSPSSCHRHHCSLFRTRDNMTADYCCAFVDKTKKQTKKLVFLKSSLFKLLP